jgi:metal-responsive CopG/Arc/MetJ family transcriptional regulator
MKEPALVALTNPSPTQYMTKVAITCPTSLLIEVDKKRKDVSRSKFLIRCIEFYLSREEEGKYLK